MTDAKDVDVLVVGSGGAGARAALEASRAGATVALAVKGVFGAIGTRGCGATAGGISESGRLRVPDDFEGRDAGFSDILQLGLGLADRKLARILVEETRDSRDELRRLGAVFGGGGIKCHGVPIMVALESALRGSHVNIWEGCMIVDLLVEDGRCVGAVGIRESDGQPFCIRAGAVILATGGAGQLYERNMQPDCVTGDGYAMGYRAGAELINMEFSQVLLGSVHPTINMASAWVWAQSPRITNRLGEEFIPSYLPAGISLDAAMRQRAHHLPFSTRDTSSRYIDVAITAEVKDGRGGPHRGAYLDLTGDRPSISSFSRQWWAYRGVDLARESIEVAPCFQCSDGGFRIDENGQTSLPGLYAAGETAGGPHGADRRGGNMLAASQVFGARAGKHSAGWSRRFSTHTVAERTITKALARIHDLAGGKGHLSIHVIAQSLQRVTTEEMLVARTHKSLAKVLDGVAEGRESLRLADTRKPAHLVKALELDNMLLVAEITARAATLRTESRGGHYREDYPERNDDEWLRVIRIRRASGRMQIDTFVIDPEWRERSVDMGDTIWG